MSGPLRLSLAQQLRRLKSETPDLDPDTAYSSLDALPIPSRENGEGREHYLDVGPSRLRQAGGQPEQTLLSDKYAGKTTGRFKIFDDDEDDEDDEGDDDDGDHDEEDEEKKKSEELSGTVKRESSDVGDLNLRKGIAHGEVSGGEGEDDDEEGVDGSERNEEDEDQVNDSPRPVMPRQPTDEDDRALDPIASLRESRVKDIEKGRGIKRQRDLFEDIVTLRITLQKALVASSKLPIPLPADSAGEIDEKKRDALRSLGGLNEKLFSMREALAIPGVEMAASTGKRKRFEGEELMEAGYWMDSARDSLAFSDASHPHILPILNKWSTKIQAASLQLGSKQAGPSKFSQSVRSGAGGIVEAIEAGLASKRNTKSWMESQESGYRSLLREIIESRSGSGPGVDLTHLRREKKKKREAERGGSKGRKLRYTVHEKAQNFVVPTPLNRGWHEEQIDELFSSLLGGVGMKGASAEVSEAPMTNGDEGLASLGGLRVF